MKTAKVSPAEVENGTVRPDVYTTASDSTTNNHVWFYFHFGFAIFIFIIKLQVN